MFKKPLFLETFLLLLIVGVLDRIAFLYNLYWSLSEYDSVVHFFGGATMSMLFSWFYFYSGFFNTGKRKFTNFFIVSVLGAMFVSFSWEIYELFLGQASIQGSAYAFDTSLDLIMDFLGAVAACFYAYLRETKSEARNLKSETLENTSNSDIPI